MAEGPCPHCRLHVNLEEHVQKCTVKRASAEAASFVKAGYIAGMKGPPKFNNRCPNEDCYLKRGHKPPCKPWPPIPKSLHGTKGS